jgi:hypothetical protein
MRGILPCMTEKASAAAGWVIEVMTLKHGGGPPSFKYLNVAIADVTKAMQAARKPSGAAQANRVEAVRRLTSDEIAALRLKVGQIKPA